MRIITLALCAVVFASCAQATGYDPLPSQAPSFERQARLSRIFNTFFDFGNGDGGKSVADLVNVRGTLYGTTTVGGDAPACGYVGCGTVFKITTSGVETVLHSFQGGTDGANPLAGLTDVNGTLYGTTAEGGSRSCNYGCGTVFKVTTSGKETVIYNFKGGRDGGLPRAGLIYANGTMYGTTAGGRENPDTVFKITTSGKKTILHRFSKAGDGAEPAARLKYLSGVLYGTTYLGGAKNGGTVFEITKSGKERVLHSFTYYGSDGAEPAAGLTDVNGTLYGTSADGANGACQQFGCGAVFELTPTDALNGG